MAVELNHTIVNVRNKEESAKFFSEILGLPPAKPVYNFLVIQTSNNVCLDFWDSEEEIESQHYAFLVSEEEFDEIFGRIKGLGIEYWADPGQKHAGKINHHDGGRGVYFEGPSGHLLEIITRPYAGSA